MTISTTDSRISYIGNDVTTEFAVPFRFLTNEDLVVVSVSAAGVETINVLTTDYTITGAGDDAGGTVTMIVAPASNTRLVIYRDTVIVQETDYISGDPFPAETHERALDRLTMIAQEIGPRSDRTIRVPVGDSASLNPTLPAALDRLDKLVAFNITTGATEISSLTQTQLASAVAAAYGTGATADASTYLPSGTGAVSRTVQSKLREFISVADYGMYPGLGSGVDCAPAFDLAIAAAIASGILTVYIPAGNYYFNTQPASITSAVRLVGDGLNSTVLIRNYNGSAGVGMINLAPGSSGAAIYSMAIDAASGTSGGHAIAATASAGAAVDGIVMEDLWISTFGTDTWVSGIHIDGTLRATGAVGVRETSLRNVNVFGAAMRAVTLLSVVNFSWHGGGMYTAGGTGAGSILIDGTASVDSTYVVVDVPTIQGTVTTGYATYVNIRATVIGGAIDNNGNSDYVTIDARVPSYAMNWTNSGVRTPAPLVGSATYDPGSLADGTFAATDVTVTGAAMGDFADASFSLDTQGILLVARVSAANTVTVVFQNETGGTLDLASGTLRALVTKSP